MVLECTIKKGRSSGGTGNQLLLSIDTGISGSMLTGLLLMTLTMLGVAPATAAWLTVPESLSLHAGGQLLQPLALVHVPGIRVQIALGEAPPGVRLIVDEAGELRVDWQTGPELASETRIEILLSDVDTGELLENREMMIRRVEPAMVPATPVAPEPVSDAVPQLAELANQVVSAGFVVSLRVYATLPEASEPVVRVDRLPGRASFDGNADGSRTFYWRTDTKDEGEHVFRFTAINPEDTRLRASREVMIVVGDPSKNTTRPEPEATAIQ